jgi:hypothetical protein
VPWERAIDLVDILMYTAKARGRNRAYGIESVDARTQAELQELSARMDAAWEEGRVQLISLHGPARPVGVQP